MTRNRRERRIPSPGGEGHMTRKRTEKGIPSPGGEGHMTRKRTGKGIPSPGGEGRVRGLFPDVVDRSSIVESKQQGETHLRKAADATSIPFA